MKNNTSIDRYAQARSKAEGDEGVEKLDKKIADFLNPENPQARKDFTDYMDARYTSDAPEDVELVTKVLESDEEVSAEDFERFVKIAEGFQKDYENAKEVAKRITEPMMQRIAQIENGDFRKFAGLMGTENVANIWKDRIPGLMARDPERFKELVDALDHYDSTKDKANEDIRARAEKLKVPEDRYIAIMAEPSREVRRKLLKQEIEANYNGLQQAASFAKGLFSKEGGQVSAAQLAERGKDELEKSLYDMDTHLLAVGKVLIDVLHHDGEDGDLSSEVRNQYVGLIRGT